MNTPTRAVHDVREQRSATDWRGLGDLVELAAERLTTPVEGIHQAIANRWFRAVGRRGSRDHAAQRVVTKHIYRSVRLVGSVAGTALGVGAEAVEVFKPVRPLWNTSVGAEVQAAANALWGDEFDHRTSPMHTQLGIRDGDGATVSTDVSSLDRAFPSATGKVAVLLHGLGKTERCWNTIEDDPADIVGLPTVLEADGFTPLLVRYNTGKRVSDNGSDLAGMLEEIVENWPVTVEEFVLIGHSMGGLVARSSLGEADSSHHEWIGKAHHVITLGTPHFGSPIEKGVHLAARVLDASTVTRPLGEFVDDRSAGIKDMRHGVSVDAGRRGEIRHHHVASVVTEDASHPFGAIVGDLVVRVGSATGRTRDGHVSEADVRVFGGLNHLGMLHDPSVHGQIREWLRQEPDVNRQGGP